MLDEKIPQQIDQTGKRRIGEAKFSGHKILQPERGTGRVHDFGLGLQNLNTDHGPFGPSKPTI